MITDDRPYNTFELDVDNNQSNLEYFSIKISTKNHTDLIVLWHNHHVIENLCKRLTVNNLFFSRDSLCDKNTHREKAPSNKTPALTKSMDMYIWAIDTLNQLLIRDL